MDFSALFSRVLLIGAGVANGLKQAHIGGTADQTHYDQALTFLGAIAGLYQALTVPAGTPQPPAA